jgi:hypothetical protein
VSFLLGTPAPAAADVVAYFEIATGLMLIAGLFFVRAGHVRLHAYLQSTIVLVNIPVILIWMVPAFLEPLPPGPPALFTVAANFLPTLMLVTGGLAEILGVYIILVAGTNWIPERWRFRSYKGWMRSVVGLWWATIVLGLLTYYVSYVAPNWNY